MIPTKPKGSNAERSRTANRQAVMGIIQSTGDMGRAQIARRLGLSTQAVSNIMAELTSEGLLVETGVLSSGRGLPAMQYGVNPTGGYAMGVEIRTNALLAALLDLSGTKVSVQRRPLTTPQPEHVASEIVKIREALLHDSKIDGSRLLGVGVVMPGPFGETGLSGLSADLPGWQSVDAGDLLSNRLSQEVLLGNDANAAAMAERISGAAHGLTNYAYLYFGTGLGLGVIADGKLISGAFGNAGEIGQIPIQTDDGPALLETRLSRLSLQHHMGAAGFSRLNFDELATLHADRNPAMTQWIGQGAKALSQALLIVENIFDPQTVLLGGAMPEGILDDLIARTTLSRSSVSQREDTGLPRLQRGATGQMTATLGAASMVLNATFTPATAIL